MRTARPTSLTLEPLESRLVPTVVPATLSGFVYVDADNDGVFDAGEQPVANVTLTLSGADVLNRPVTGVATTTASGFYAFTGLNPGTYTVTETQPAGYLDGKDTPGSTGGSNAVNDALSAIPLTATQTNSVNNNFGELLPPPPPPCTPPETTGREGLTPGYWKNNAVKHNASAWGPTGYFQYQTLGSVFSLAGTPYADLANKTLVQALSVEGGGANALLRHAVAAVLNASHPEVDYPLTTTQIIDRVNAALASGSVAQIEALKTELDGYNNLGADLDQFGRVV